MALLAAATRADPGDRIQFRDPIAAFRTDGIAAMTGWLEDPRLGAFAVRVLSRIADDPTQRRAVVSTLLATDSAKLSEPVARDVSEAISRLGGGAQRAPAGSKRAPVKAEEWPEPHRQVTYGRMLFRRLNASCNRTPTAARRDL